MTGAPDPDVPADAFRGEGPGAQLIRPACSVIVPVCDQWPLVPALLESLRAQTLPQDEFEVMLVDMDRPTTLRQNRCRATYASCIVKRRDPTPPVILAFRPHAPRGWCSRMRTVVQHRNGSRPVRNV